jgi:phosphatidylinositol glycan class P protein
VAKIREADGKARDTGLLGKDVEWRRLWSEGTDAVMDVPIGGVCEILYGAGRMLENQREHEL